MQQQTNNIILTPYQQLSDLKQTYHRLMSFCEQHVPSKIEKVRVKTLPTLEDILAEIDQKNEQEQSKTMEMHKTMSYEEKLNFIVENPDLISTNFYIQQVILESQTKTLKTEVLNVSMYHMEQGFPDLKKQDDKLKKCSLKSLQYKQQLDDQRRLRQRTLNILKPIDERYDLGLKNMDMNEVIIHCSVFHPFTKKKTQELLLLGCQTLQEIGDLIKCVVLKTEERYYKEELDNFEQPIFDLSKDQTQKIGNIRLQLCKIYHFVHLNGCIHWLVFHEIREVSQQDVKDIEEYRKGLNVFQAPPFIKNCEGCGLQAECFRLQDPKVSTETPCFLCNQCDDLLHKHQNGEKKYNIENSIPYCGHQ